MRPIITPITVILISAIALIISCKKNDTIVDSLTGADTMEVSACSTATGLEKVVCLAQAFKATLSSSQLTTVQLAYSKADAVKWSNFPQGTTSPKRVGISLGSLNTAQLAAAKALMAAVLVQDIPNEGYEEFEGSLAADDYLSTLTGNTTTFGSGNFYLAFLGVPSTTGLWELQYGGHHFAFADTYSGGKVTGVTPSFRGVEPMTAFTANGKTYQTMEQERLAFADMLAALSTIEKTSAKLAATFSEILLAPGVDGQFPTTRQGIKAGDLTAAQKALVLKAISLYVNDLDGETAAVVMAKYTAELDNTYLAYSGTATMSTQSDYVRIDGPGVWIEYSTQGSRDIPGGVHPHSVWRDRTNDYGGN